MLLLLRAEAQLVDQLERIAQAVAAAELVFDLAEDLADLVLDRVRAFGALLEARAGTETDRRSTNSIRSSPVSALSWSNEPSAFFGAAQVDHRCGLSMMNS